MRGKPRFNFLVPAVSEKTTMQNRAETIQTITNLHLTKKMIGEACGLVSQRVSDFCGGVPLPTETEDKIITTVALIEYVWKYFEPFRVELNSPELLMEGVRIAREVEMTRSTQELTSLMTEAFKQ